MTPRNLLASSVLSPLIFRAETPLSSVVYDHNGGAFRPPFSHPQAERSQTILRVTVDP